MKLNKKIVSIGLSAGLLLSALAPIAANAQTYYYRYTYSSPIKYTYTYNYGPTTSRTYTRTSININDYLNKYNNSTTQTTTPTQPAQPSEPAPQPAPTPAPQPQPTPQPAPVEKPNNEATSTERQYEIEVIRLVNIERQKEGLKPLTENTELSKVAKAKSQDMKDKGYFSHTSPTYGSPFDMMKSFGINYMAAGENIARGQRTPAAVVEGWMNSPGHRRNIMSPSFTQIGVGCVTGGNGPYWTQMFINPR